MATKKSTKKSVGPTTHLSIAEYIDKRIELLNLRQKDIAAELGYTKANMITMLKQGRTKVPISKVPLLARALKEDPSHLLNLVMTEYQPEIWEAIQSIHGTVLTKDERDVIAIYRDVTKHQNPELTETQKRNIKSKLNSVFKGS